MSLAKLAVGPCAAVALAAAAFDADAGGGRGGRHGGGHGLHTSSSHGRHYHHGHGYRYTSVFVGASYVLWQSAYYYWRDYRPDYRPDYNPGMPAVEYWYYCQPYAAYYPYVQECPTEWQPVLPTPPSPGN